MRGPAGVPYGQERDELVAALRLFAGPYVAQVPAASVNALVELAVYRARQVGRFYLNATGAREGSRRPLSF